MLDYNFRDLEAFAARFYQGHPLELTPYAYTLTFSNLLSLGQATQQLNFQANADFILTNVEALAVIHGTAHGITYSSQIIPLVRMLLTDSGSSQPLTNTAVALSAYSEVGSFQKCIPYPRFLSGRSSLQVQLFSFDDTAAYDIDLVFVGINVRAVIGA